MTVPRGRLATLAYDFMVQDPLCWKTMSGPPGPVDSKLIIAPSPSLNLLCSLKACAPRRKASSPPLSRNTTGACSFRDSSLTSKRANSKATPTQLAQSDAPEAATPLIMHLNYFAVAFHRLTVRLSQSCSHSRNTVSILDHKVGLEYTNLVILECCQNVH